MADFIFFAWMASGAICHIMQANEMKTDFGKPIWDVPITYVMFIPAVIAGPILFFFFERMDDRHPERRPPQSLSRQRGNHETD